MILEQPLLNLVRLDTFDGVTWVPWAGAVRSLTVQRGGQRSGPVSTVKPGILSATLVNAGDPLAEGVLKPNLPIRMVTPYTTLDDFDAPYAGLSLDERDALWAGSTLNDLANEAVELVTIFTGRIHDLNSAYLLDKSTGATTTTVTITASDAVASHANVTRYGAVTEGGVERETWAARIIRLAASSVTEIEPPADDSPIVRYAIG